MDGANIYKYSIEIFHRNNRFKYLVPILWYNIQHNRRHFANNLKLLICVNIQKKVHNLNNIINSYIF